jgi:transcriptional regulator with XRE-family HTH domain
MKSEIQLLNSIGKVLLSKRLSLAADGIKVTQEDIAFNAGISTRQYGKLERGEAMPTLYTLMRIAPTLQLSLSELCKQIEEY